MQIRPATFGKKFKYCDSFYIPIHSVSLSLLESSLEMGDTLFFSSVDLSSLIPPKVERLPELRAILGFNTTHECKPTFSSLA